MYKYLKLSVYIGTVLIFLSFQQKWNREICVEFLVHLLQNDSNDKVNLGGVVNVPEVYAIVIRECCICVLLTRIFQTE